MHFSFLAEKRKRKSPGLINNLQTSRPSLPLQLLLMLYALRRFRHQTGVDAGLLQNIVIADAQTRCLKVFLSEKLAYFVNFYFFWNIAQILSANANSTKNLV